MTQRIDAHFVAAGKYHDIDFARLELLKLLAEHPHIRTTVATDYSDVERIAACKFLITSGRSSGLSTPPSVNCRIEFVP